MRSTTLTLPTLRRPRTTLQAHTPLQAHALLHAKESLTHQTERSPVAQSIAAALPGSSPISALDLAASGLPLGAVLAEVGELAKLSAVQVKPPLEAGDPAASEPLSRLDAAASASSIGDAVSMKIAVAGPRAHAVVESLGQVRHMEGIVDRLLPTERLPGRAPQPWVFTRLASGPHVVYVVGDGAAPGNEAWYQLLRGAVGVVVTVDAGVDSGPPARSALGAARTAGLPCVLAGEVEPEQVRAVMDAVVPVATVSPGDEVGSRAALRLLARTIEEQSGGRR